MTDIDLNRIKGNFGSSYVSYKLSKNCLIRQVTEGTDIGIDLYCESITEDGLPFLHFWVQVKSGGSIKVGKDISFASFSFDTKHLKYWHRQPVPVFAFLVPIDWPQIEENIRVYVVNITDYMLKNSILDSQKSISIKSNKVLITEDDYKNFIKIDVPYLTAAQNITKGSVRMIPVYTRDYIHAVPTGYSIKYLEEIIWQLRTTAGVALRDLFHSNTKSEYIQTLTKVLEAYSDDKHWEVHYSLGIAYNMIGDLQRAIDSFQNSINIIESDPNINQDSWSHNKRMLRDHIKSCEKVIKSKPNKAL